MERIELLPFTVSRAQYLRGCFVSGLPRIMVLTGIVIAVLIALAAMKVFPPAILPYECVFAVLLYLAVQYFMCVARTSPSKNPLLYSEWRCTFDDSTLEMEISAGVKNTIPWRVLVKARRMGDFYMLYVAPLQALYIPASAFGSAAEEQRFREIVAANTRVNWT